MAPGRAQHRHPHHAPEGLGDPPRERPELTSSAILGRAAELAAADRSFVMATVVAVRKPTSARPGASGIIHPDGTIEGWV
ncbi:MAG: XdhC family protein, partial [Chloroflexota bacterium]